MVSLRFLFKYHQYVSSMFWHNFKWEVRKRNIIYNHQENSIYNHHQRILPAPRVHYVVKQLVWHTPKRNPHPCFISILNISITTTEEVVLAFVTDNKLYSTELRLIRSSLRPRDTYMRRPTRPPLVQMMACRLFRAKPLSKRMLGYCKLDHCEHISMKFWLKYMQTVFIAENAFENIGCEMVAILSPPQCVNKALHIPLICIWQIELDFDETHFGIY